MNVQIQARTTFLGASIVFLGNKEQTQSLKKPVPQIDKPSPLVRRLKYYVRPWGDPRMVLPCYFSFVRFLRSLNIHIYLAQQVLGTLNNLTALDLPKGIGWVDVLSNYALAPFLTKLLVPGMAQNDVILEVR